MSHDVFISHSSIDKATSDAMTTALESAGIRCWVAPRDIMPSDDLDYFLSSTHWLDALAPSLDQHLETLITTAQQLLNKAVAEENQTESNVQTSVSDPMPGENTL